MKILERFEMVDYKSVTTLMELNFKKLCGSVVGPDLGNPSEYRNLWGPNVLGELLPGHIFYSEYIEPVYCRASSHTMDCCQESLGLRYTAGNVRLHGFFDADWVGSVVDRKSTFGCCFSLGSTSISWMSRKQKSVALSTAEAEYIAASLLSCEVVWLRKLFSELFGHVLDTTVIFYDNQSGIRLS